MIDIVFNPFSVSWAKTTPIRVTRTVKPPQTRPPRTTTPLVRVPDSVAIAVPVVLFCLAFVVGLVGFIGRRFTKSANSSIHSIN